MPEAEQKSSYGRWYILGLICLMYLITYLDRVVMSNTAPEIQKEFGIDNATKGWILSSLFWGYSLFQVPGGRLSERFGPRVESRLIEAARPLVDQYLKELKVAPKLDDDRKHYVARVAFVLAYHWWRFLDPDKTEDRPRPSRGDRTAE